MARPDRPVWKKLAWFVAIWCASLLAIGIVAYILRLWIA